eukprot:6198516-Pleurochrysis_carterae.AAC.5
MDGCALLQLHLPGRSRENKVDEPKLQKQDQSRRIDSRHQSAFWEGAASSKCKCSYPNGRSAEIPVGKPQRLKLAREGQRLAL